MQPADEHWRRVEALYHEVVARPPEERVPYVKRAAAGDAALQDDVEGLLRAHDELGSYLEEPIVGRIARGLADSQARRLIGRRIGSHAVQALIGAGGMGEVYRARDTKLQRDVAIKVVAPHLAADPAFSPRLLREARHASSLNHPAICTIHDVGEHEGQPYIVMEFVDGETLAERIDRGALPVDQAIDVAHAVASALVHAHRAGVVHGDLKSPNVMLRVDGQVKVLDFGVARRPHAPARADAHRPPSTVQGFRGTVSSAAPEVLLGAPSDAQSDVWSLGVLLFEMVAAHMPFGHGTPESVSAILTAPVPPMPGTVPPDVQRIVHRCLERDRSLRYATAAQVSGDLEATRMAFGPSQAGRRAATHAGVGRGSVVLLSAACVAVLGGTGQFAVSPDAPRIRVAVVPAQLLFHDADVQQLGVGITDTIGAHLARSSRVLVRSLPAPDVRAATAPSDDEILRTWKVDYVLRANLRHAANTYRLNLKLMASDNVLAWGEDYGQPTDALYELALEASRGVLSALHIAPVERPMNQPRTAEAFDDYVRGRAALTGISDAAKETAVEAFRAALRADPEYAPAYAGLAIASARMYFSAGEQRQATDWARQAMDAAAEALRRDGELAEAHEAIAAVHRYNESDWRKVVDESLLALRLNPGLALPHQHLAVAYYHLGFFHLSRAAATAGLAANPEARAAAAFNRGRTAFYEGRYEEAIPLLRRASDVDTDGPAWVLAEALYYAGDEHGAALVLERLLGARSAVTRVRAAASLAAFRASSSPQEARRRLTALERSGLLRDHHVTYRIGTAYAQLGDAAAARRWLERAFDDGFPCYAWYARDPLLDPVRSAAGIQQLLRTLRGRSDAARDLSDAGERFYAEWLYQPRS